MHTPSKYRRYLLAVLAMSLGLLALPAGLVLAVDPLQIYHRHIFTDVQFLTQERFQNAGLINNYLADDGVKALVLGTSMSQNFLSSKVEAEMGWGKTLRLTASGGTPRELRTMLDYALTKGAVRAVLWEVHTPYVDPDTEATHRENLFPTYLYNDSKVDDARYLFSNDAVEMLFKVIAGKYDGNLDRLSYWMDRAIAEGAFKAFNAPQNLAAFASKLATRRKANDQYDPLAGDGEFPNVDVNLLEVVAAHEDVHFIVYIPPISTLNYALMKPSDFQRFLSLRRYIVNQAAQYPNLELYAFDDVAWIGGNIKNYKDLGHYDVSVNEYMLRAIKAGQHRLTLDNIDDYEQAFVNVVKFYALDVR